MDYHIITGACQFLKCWVLDEAVQGKGVSELISYKGWSWGESLQRRWRGLPHLVRVAALEGVTTFGAHDRFETAKSLCGFGLW